MFAGMMARPRATSERTNSGIEPLPDGHERHLRSHHALAREMELGHAATAPPLRDPRLAQLRQSLVTSQAWGPLVSYTRSVSPLESEISRIGTRTPGPSTCTLRDAGKAEVKSQAVSGARQRCS